MNLLLSAADGNHYSIPLRNVGDRQVVAHKVREESRLLQILTSTGFRCDG